MKLIKFLFKLLILFAIGYLVFYWYNNAIVLKKQEKINKTSTNIVESFYSQLALNKKDILSNNDYLDIAIFDSSLIKKITRLLKTDPEYNFIICEENFPNYFNISIKEEYVNKIIYTVTSDFQDHLFEVTTAKEKDGWIITDINCINY